MSEMQQANFEGWALVEMMGHQREIGFVTTQAFGQAVMFRIDTPELPERELVLKVPEYTQVDAGSPLRQWTSAGAKVKRPAIPARSRLVAPGALYAINPCTEEAARAALEGASDRPLILIEAPPAKAIAAADEDDEDDEERPDPPEEDDPYKEREWDGYRALMLTAPAPHPEPQPERTEVQGG